MGPGWLSIQGLSAPIVLLETILEKKKTYLFTHSDTEIESLTKKASLQFIVEATLLSLIVIILNSNRSVFHYFLKIQFTTFRWTRLQMHDFLISVEFGPGSRFFGMLCVKILRKSLSGAFVSYSSSFHDQLLLVTSSLVSESEMLLTVVHTYQYAPCQTQVL